MEDMNNSSREDLIAEIERLEIENANLRCNINVYISALNNIRDLANKYAPEVTDIVSNCSCNMWQGFNSPIFLLYGIVFLIYRNRYY